MHMKAPITNVVRMVVPIMSGSKIRGSDSLGSGGPPLALRAAISR